MAPSKERCPEAATPFHPERDCDKRRREQRNDSKREPHASEIGDHTRLNKDVAQIPSVPAIIGPTPRMIIPNTVCAELRISSSATRSTYIKAEAKTGMHNPVKSG